MLYERGFTQPQSICKSLRRRRMNAHAQQVNIFPVGYRMFFLFPKAVSLTHVDKHAGVAEQRLMAISD